MPRRKQSEEASALPVRPREQRATFSVSLPISIVNEIDRERQETSISAGRSGLITQILRDHYDARREKELAGAV